MRFDIALFLTLAVFLTSIDLGYSKTPVPERYHTPTAGRESPGGGLERPQRPNRQPPNRQPSPPPVPLREGYDAVITNQLLNIGRGFLAKTRTGALHTIDGTYRAIELEDGYVIAVIDPTNFISPIFYPARIPGTIVKVKVNANMPTDIRPLSPEEIADFPSEEFSPRITYNPRSPRRNNQ